MVLIDIFEPVRDLETDPIEEVSLCDKARALLVSRLYRNRDDCCVNQDIPQDLIAGQPYVGLKSKRSPSDSRFWAWNALQSVLGGGSAGRAVRRPVRSI